MFKKPFSFKGRIRRTEYVLSYLLAFCLFIVWSFFTSYIDNHEIKAIVLLVAFYWFIFAQGAKRCHDMGNSGFFQIIPFFNIAMLFAEGEPRENKYGILPKRTQHSREHNENSLIYWPIILPKNKTKILSLAELFTFSLALLLAYSLLYTLPVLNKIITQWLEFVMLLTGYFLLLVYTNEAKPLGNFNAFYFFQRCIFSVIFCTLLFVYKNFFVTIYPFEIASVIGIFFDSILVCMITYVPYSMYKSFFTKKVSHAIE